MRVLLLLFALASALAPSGAYVQSAPGECVAECANLHVPRCFDVCVKLPSVERECQRCLGRVHKMCCGCFGDAACAHPRLV